MDIQRLEEFTVLAQSASFRDAAQKLGISPALLTSHIAALEKKLDARLFDRDAHSLVLTDAGPRFLVDAKELTAEYQQILGSIGALGEKSNRSLKIGMSGFVMPAKLGPYLDTVNLQYPDIELEIYDDSRYGIESGLRGGHFDLFFTHCRDDLSFPGIEKQFVYSTRVQVLVPLSHHLASRSSVSLSELDGERFVLYPPTAEPAAREWEAALLEESGISYSVYENYISPNVYYVMVPVGKGLVLCPWVHRNEIPPNTVALSVNDPGFEVSMYMFYRPDSKNPYVSEFVESFRLFNRGR